MRDRPIRLEAPVINGFGDSPIGVPEGRPRDDLSIHLLYAEEILVHLVIQIASHEGHVGQEAREHIDERLGLREAGEELFFEELVVAMVAADEVGGEALDSGREDGQAMVE